MTTAQEHWDWLRNVLFETYRVGYVMAPFNEGDWNEDAIKESFSIVEPLLKRIYIDAFEHGKKHAKEATS